MGERIYAAIDLKSFYASVECVDKGLDPLKANLVVADESRTEKTICLAVSPSLKSYGIPGRARLFEVNQKVEQINIARKRAAKLREFSHSSSFNPEVVENPDVALDFVIATPRMSRYMEVSAKVYSVYLQYIAPEDIHVYSIDEVFIDVTDYLELYGCDAKTLAMRMIKSVLKETGITATCGIGTNLYLAKIAMDIVAKKMPADENGVRIAELDEMSYRRKLWNHRPLTDFWRIGRGYAARLEKLGLYTMEDVARCSVGAPNEFYNEELLYKNFGVNAELLIDHAWGFENCTIEEIRKYQPKSTSLSSGQVLTRPYKFDEAEIIVKEMTDLLVLDMVQKGFFTNQLVLYVCYDTENVRNFSGSTVSDHYGRKMPKPARATVNLDRYMSSSTEIISAVVSAFENVCDKDLTIRRIGISVNNLKTEQELQAKPDCRQFSLFSDYSAEAEKTELQLRRAEQERKIQLAMIDIRNRYGKNAILKGVNFLESGTTRQRNCQVGGHRA